MSRKDDEPILQCVNDLLKNNKDISIDYISKKCYLSKSGVTRFFKDNGFDGFKEFKYLLLNETNQLTFNQKDYSKDWFDQELIFNSVKSTKLLNDEESFEKAYQCLIKSNNNYIVGLGGNNSVCLELKTRLERFGFKTFHNFDIHGTFVEINNASSNDIVWFFSYTGETSELLKVAKLCKEKNITIISFTRNEHNTLSDISDIVFKVENSEPLIRMFSLKSRFSMIYIVYKLCWYIYRKDPIKYDQILKRNIYH